MISQIDGRHRFKCNRHNACKACMCRSETLVVLVVMHDLAGAPDLDGHIRAVLQRDLSYSMRFASTLLLLSN